ncbi:unnamed protein product, partial [Ectocarpus sp. 12 AP-2014]
AALLSPACGTCPTPRLIRPLSRYRRQETSTNVADSGIPLTPGSAAEAITIVVPASRRKLPNVRCTNGFTTTVTAAAAAVAAAATDVGIAVYCPWSGIARG